MLCKNLESYLCTYTVIVIFQFVGILFNFVVTLQLPPRIMGDIVFLPLPDKMIRNLPFP